MFEKAQLRDFKNRGITLSARYVVIVVSMLIMYFAYLNSCNAEDLYTLSGEYSSTSDDVDLYTAHFSYINNRRKYYWPYQESPSSTVDTGFLLNRYNGQTEGARFVGWEGLQSIGGQLSHSLYIKGGLGLHLLDVEGTVDDKSIVTYDVVAQFDPVEQLNINLSATKNYVYQLGVQPAGVQQLLYANQWQGGFEWYPVKTIRVIVSDSKWKLSDDNYRREKKFSVLYGISPDSPWIWAGVFHEILNFDEQKADYWTPEKFLNSGLMWESSFSISDSLTGTVAATISRIKEDEYPQGDGNSIFAGLDYKLMSEQVLRLGFRKINSSQGKSSWDERAFNLSINGSFQ